MHGINASASSSINILHIMLCSSCSQVGFELNPDKVIMSMMIEDVDDMSCGCSCSSTSLRASPHLVSRGPTQAPWRGAQVSEPPGPRWPSAAAAHSLPG